MGPLIRGMYAVKNALKKEEKQRERSIRRQLVAGKRSGLHCFYVEFTRSKILATLAFDLFVSENQNKPSQVQEYGGTA